SLPSSSTIIVGVARFDANSRARIRARCLCREPATISPPGWTGATPTGEDAPMVALRRDAKAEMLRRVPLLSRCSKRDLRDVASLAEERPLEPGVELTHEGDPGLEFFILIDGRVDVRRRKRKIAEIGRGGFFGEIALLTEAPRNATVSTAVPTRVL